MYVIINKYISIIMYVIQKYNDLEIVKSNLLLYLLYSI